MRKTRATIIAIFLIMAAIHYQLVRAADLYVDVALGTNNPTCGTASGASACKNITYTISSRAVANDTVHVAAGTYNTASGETFPISITKNLTLQGNGSATTIIDQVAQTQNVISVNGAFVVNISGFTIRNGVRGLYYRNGASGNIENNVIERNAHNGIQNGDTSGAGTAANPTIRFNYISQNGIISSVSGIRNNFSNPVIHTNVIDRNYYGIFNSNSSPTITNNTIVGNTVHGIANNSLSSPTVTNNIITNNGALNWHRGIHSDGTGTVTNDYNDVWNNTGGNYSAGIIVGAHSISQDPLFVSYPPDVHLQCTPTQSPAIDAGTSAGAPATDIDGTIIPQGAGVDMGAYETACYSVTANANGTGTGTVTSNVGGINYNYPANNTGTTSTLNYGSSITLTAAAGIGSTAAWNDCVAAGGAVAGNGTATATCTFSSLNGNKTVTATFTLNQYALTVTIVGNGSVTSNPAGIDCGSDCVEVYNYGTIVTLTAIPTALSSFTGWSGACTGAALTCTLTIDAAKNVTAIFGIKQGKRVQLPFLLPLALNNMASAKTLLNQANDLLTQAKAKELDTGTCEKLINEATELYEKAKKFMNNPYAANYFALQAAQKLGQAIECLKALLG